MGMLSILDSYYAAVVQQMTTIGARITVPNVGSSGVQTIPQPFGGIVNAADWPQTPVVNAVTPEGTLYLLVVNQVPIERRSQAQIEYEFQCNWQWILLGTDLQAFTQGLNRSDRYRTDMQIRENLRQANYPGFCRQQDSSLNPESGAITWTNSVTPYPTNPIEIVRWSKLRFMPKYDNQNSGVVYGSARVEVIGISDVLAAIA